MFPYLPEMIESFDVPKNAVSKWAGITSAVFSLSQAVTGVIWGRASDKYGRKPAILCAMLCTMSTSLLFGFSRSLAWAIIARCLAGASNGSVGILRTTVAEMVPYKELQPSAFSVMPLVWTIGSIFGPGFGGALANPATKYPKVFGGIEFFKEYRFALPNIAATIFFLFGTTTGFLFLQETLETKRHRRDYGRLLGELICHPFRTRSRKPTWQGEEEQSKALLKHSRISSISSVDGASEAQENQKVPPLAPPTYREVFSSQSNLNLLTYTLLAGHSIAYDQILPIFMHYPPQIDRSHDPNVRLPLKFAGGFGISSGRIGLIFTLYGIVGMFIQFFVFPPFARRYGVLSCLKAVTAMFPVVYIVTPFTALFSNTLSQQIAIFCIMMFKCWAAIFAFPCTTILLTNSAVSLRVLGTLNGVAVSTSALGRAIGPAVIGWLFSVGVSKGYMIIPLWALAGFAVLGAITPWWLVEMEGFNSGEDNDDKDDDTENIMYTEAEDERGSNNPIDLGSLAETFTPEDSTTIGSTNLSKTTSRTSEGQHFLPLKRISSPIGMKGNVGPGGSDKLSNGLGPTRSGYEASGASLH